MWFNINQVRSLASQWGFQEVQYNPTSCVIGFRRGNELVNVYYSTGTVGTCTNHPKQGKTQLFRRHVSYDDLARIFQNVRTHTGLGYYRRLTTDDAPEPSLGSRKWWGCMEDLDELFKNDPDDTPFVTLGPYSYFVVDSDGNPYWGSGTPKHLHNKLWGRQRELPSVDYVAMGPDESYFVQFTDGVQEWRGLPSDLSQSLYDASGSVTTMALGRNGEWYCKWEDGSYEWKGLPISLHNKLNGRQKFLPPVDQVVLGPNDAWFVSFEDGDWHCRNVPQQCSFRIERIQNEGGNVVHVALGGTEDDPTWLIVYDE